MSITTPGRLILISGTQNPESVITLAMKQCRSHYPNSRIPYPPATCGETVDKLLGGKRGHFGPLEHTNFVFQGDGFSHCLMQQLRTHRVGVSFDVESFRSVGKRFRDDSGVPDEILFYLPESLGETGIKIFKGNLAPLRKAYSLALDSGASYEDARFLLPGYAMRQNFIFSGNLRSLWHILDLRSKRDAQEEIRIFSSQLHGHLMKAVPHFQEWYQDNRYSKALLAP